jgi:hypothetical protein
MKYLAPILQIVGLGLITLAFAALSPVAGAAVGGIAVLLIGLSLESPIVPKKRGR